jgi:signal peptidase I
MQGSAMSLWVQERRGGHRFSETARIVLEALVIALVIRSFLFQPFNIPSGSMEPTLLVGDYLFASKFSYGFSRNSLPFSPPLFSGRILATPPNRGDIVIFRHGSEDFIKRVIGLPGDRIQLIGGIIFINGVPVGRQRIADFVGPDPCRPTSAQAPPVRVVRWRESLPNGVSYDTLQCSSASGFPDNTNVYVVPPRHFFMMGDNRENSEDSRFPDVGYVPFENLIARAQLIFFSIGDGKSMWELWSWPWSVRWDRLLTLIR